MSVQHSLKTKLQISCENVNDLAEELGTKKRELQDQDHQISLSVNQSQEHEKEQVE